jgi:hypothetical protein
VYQFITQQSITHKTTKRAIIEEAIRFYQRQQLKHQVKEGLQERYEEYKDLNAEISTAQFTSLKA